jgi:hypothetical protein
MSVCTSSDTAVRVDPRTLARAVAGKTPATPLTARSLSVLGDCDVELPLVRKREQCCPAVA